MDQQVEAHPPRMIDEGRLVKAAVLQAGDEICKRGVWHRISQVNRQPNGTIYLATETACVLQTAVEITVRARIASDS